RTSSTTPNVIDPRLAYLKFRSLSLYIPPQLFAPRRHRVHRGLVTPQNDSETFPLGLVDQEDEVFAAFRGLRFRDGLLANLAGTTTGSGEREDLSNHGSHPLTAPGRYGSFRG